MVIINYRTTVKSQGRFVKCVEQVEYFENNFLNESEINYAVKDASS